MPCGKVRFDCIVRLRHAAKVPAIEWLREIAMSEENAALRRWSALDADEQLALQAAYQSELDKEPPTCSLETKVERFARWLASRGVFFSMDEMVSRPVRKDR
ncbi:MAG TPA: hypothetical protein DIC56_19305 [Rhizobium sp.]|nr:hypothetical protein [Rhizobium sp.]